MAKLLTPRKPQLTGPLKGPLTCYTRSASERRWSQKRPQCEMKRPPDEAALLCVLRVKRGLLSVQISNQLFGPVNGDLVTYRQKYSPIPLNRLIYLDALLTHLIVPHLRESRRLLLTRTTEQEDCSS